MRQLNQNETEQVGGGIAFLAPVVWAMLADASFWTTMSAAAGAGYKIGSAYVEWRTASAATSQANRTATGTITQ
jgi:hypothetical protein